MADVDALLADYEALRHGVGAYHLPRDVVAVEGPDAVGYLQGQLSQDVATLAVGGSAPSLVLEPDGKLAALVRVLRTGAEGFTLDTDAGFGGVVASRLRRFRLRTKVEIEPVGWPCIALRGAGVPRGEALARPVDAAGPWVAPVEWNGTVGADLLGPGADRLVPGGARWCGEDAWEALRIEAGIPAMGTELDARTIAAEAGLVERTVSFTKGCYTGQELVARLDARGSRVARRLCGVIVDAVPGSAGPSPATLEGATLYRPGDTRPVGSCTSAAWCPGIGALAGLCYLHRSIDVPAEVGWTPVGSGEGAERMAARAVPLPLVP